MRTEMIYITLQLLAWALFVSAAAIDSIRRSRILLELALYTQGLAILVYLIPKAFA